MQRRSFGRLGRPSCARGRSMTTEADAGIRPQPKSGVAQRESDRGAAGIDGETLKAVVAYGVARMLAELGNLLLAGRYRPQPSLRVNIPKPGRPGEERPLSIPRVRDRVAQTAAKLVLEAIFEASFLPTSFGFRPKRGAHQALELIRKTVNQGARWVVDLDFKDYFGSLDEALLLGLVGRRVSAGPQAAGAPGQDPGRGPERRGRRVRLPGLPQPTGEVVEDGEILVPALAVAAGDGRPAGQGQGDHGPALAPQAAHQRPGRRAQPRPPRVVQLLPLGQLVPALLPDRQLRPGAVGALR